MGKGFEPYFEAIRFLEGLANIPKQKDYMRDRREPQLYLKRMRCFFKLIGILEQKRFQFVHVAGTSGKGSVTAMLHETLRAAGKQVGSFTSPFATTSIEKVRVGDEYISAQELVEIVKELKPQITKAYLQSPYGGPSYFEIWFALAVLYFLRKKCEWVVLEVGLGGAYDPGVLLSGCVATVLTNVDYDHTHLLGRTLTKIGREKIGIARRGVPLFTAEQRPQLLRMFERLTKKISAELVAITPPASPYLKGRKLLVARVGMDYQGMNAALAQAVTEYLKIPSRAMVKGIKEVRLPCRFEVMQKKPMVVLDGAHSVAKMRSTLQNLRALPFRKLHVVLAIASNKDVEGICKVIVPRADRVYVTRFDMPLRKCAHPKDLMRAAEKYARRGTRMAVYLDNRDALRSALKSAGPSDCVLVTGSFFLAGKLRERWYSEEHILKTRKSF